ncbi:MAG: FecR family protein [Agriterribacter sp.]
MSETDFKILLERYLNDSISAEELPQFLTCLREYRNNLQLKDAIQKALSDKNFEGISDKSRGDIIFQKIMQQAAIQETSVVAVADAIDVNHARKTSVFKWLSAAAILVIAVSGAYYFLSQQKKEYTVASVKKTTPDVMGDVRPGGNKAILKLADGTTIALDDAANGTIAAQGNTTVQKLGDGELAYNKTAQKISIPLYNSISTPRGGQYRVILPDGSKVWLNAESSLYFPTAFTGKERGVTLIGEAYFEIAHNKQMPFKVRANNMTVEVLGTHFNIMTYQNEELTHTTLLEGSVKVTLNVKGEPTLTLVQGQQVILKKNSETYSINSTDVDAITAWKNGKFQFNGDNIQTIMRQIERWYDVEVHYSGKIPDGHYSGTISRDNNLLKVLKIFEAGDLKFSIKGKKLTVL